MLRFITGLGKLGLIALVVVALAVVSTISIVAFEWQQNRGEETPVVRAATAELKSEVAAPLATPNPSPTVVPKDTPTPEKVAVALADSNADVQLVATAASGSFWLNYEEIYVPLPTGVTPPGAFLALEPQELSGCGGESLSNCVRAPREKNGQNVILQYYGKNPTECWQDGFVWDPTSGKMLTYAPPGFVGFTEGLTLRRCSSMTEPKDAWRHTAAGPANRNLSPSSSGGIGGPVSNPTVVVPSGYVVAQSTLNVRGGPGTNFPVVGSVALGQQVPEIGRQGSWINIQLSNGVNGWIAGWLTDQNLPAPAGQIPSPTAIPIPQGGGGQTTTTFAATVLSGSVNWQACETSARCWNAYSNGSGTPVRMSIACQQDGARLVNGQEVSGLPAGEHDVLGITDRGCK